MQNQPFSEFDRNHPADGSAAISPRRLVWLNVMFLLALLLIGARVVHVQARIADQFLDPWKSIRTEDEALPARDGRILSRDGVILAQDETRYDVAVHYRWLEFPPDPVWVRQQVWKRLPRQQRKDPVLRQKVEADIIQQHERLRENLARAAGLSPELVAERMQGIQRRVESMVAAVERRREERRQQADSPGSWPSSFTEARHLLWEELTRTPERNLSEPVVLKEELTEHVLLHDVSLQVVAAIQSQPTGFPGVLVKTATTRIYPEGALAAHAIGMRRLRQDGGIINKVIESGIERAQDRTLSGVPGTLRRELDRRGGTLGSEQIVPPRDGADVVLTLDSRLQRFAEELLDQAVNASSGEMNGPTGGCLIAVDIWSGDVLTLASSPRPSLPILSRPTTEQWRELVEDPRRPLFPRPTQLALPAGSLFHLVTSIAALESVAASPEELLECRGYLDRPERDRCALFRQTGQGHGALRLEEALRESCHVCFFQMARRLPAGALHDWAGRLGFGERTGIDLPGEQTGRLPPFTGQPELQFAIGQGSLLVTPLQVVRLMAAIANDGYLITPRVAQSTQDGSPAAGQVWLKRIEGLSPQTSRTVRRAMVRTIDDPLGPGRLARVESLPIAGKTGTAESPGHREHAWLAGFAPADAPRIAFVVVLEEGGEAGSACGPLVRDYLTEMLGWGLLRPTVDELDSRFSPPPVDPVSIPAAVELRSAADSANR